MNKLKPGITLAFKVHVGTPVDNTARLIQILDEIDSPTLGAILDTSELCRAGEDPSEFVSKIGSRIVHVHFRDYPHRGQIPTDVASTYLLVSGSMSHGFHRWSNKYRAG